VALDIALQTIPLCGPSLPKQALPILTEVQMNALEALSGFDFASHPSLISNMMQMLVILWSLYSSLCASCNIKHLAKCIITALNPELEGGVMRIQEAIVCGKELVVSLMRVMSDSQLQALDKEGVYKQLRLLMLHYEEMSVDDMKQIVIGVGTFAEVVPSSKVFLEEHSYLGFIQSSLKHPSDETLQSIIWQLMAVLCRFDSKFAEGIFAADILSSILVLIETKGCPIHVPVRFLTLCCQMVPVCINSCLSHKPFMTHVLGFLKSYCSESPDRPSEVSVTCMCDFLAALCKTDSNVASVLDWKVISHLEDCARVQPDIALFQTCVAIEGVSNCFQPTLRTSTNILLITNPLSDQRRVFSEQDHHLFFKDLLSHPTVGSQPKFIKLMYITFQKLLRSFTPEAMKKLHTKDFLEFFSVCFIRDTISYPGLISRIVFTTHYFIFEMRQKDPISFLNELNFHATVATLLQESSKIDNIATIMGLLACLVGKYYEFLKDTKPFLKVQVQDTLLDKALVFGHAGKSVQFSDDFSRVMLNLTADKDLSLELYDQGYLDRLVKLMDDKAMCDVRRSMIHAAGNIALGGQNIKQVLIDRQFYLKLLSILRSEVKTSDPFLLSACCRVLHILASGDWAKRRFVECGCVEVLLEVMRTRKDNPEVCWRPLGLLSSLGFMAVTNRRYVLTEDVLEVVSSILKESNNGKVISYTTLIFLGVDELDEGARRLRELGIGNHLQSAIDKPEYRKQAPDMERWGMHVLEKQNLYTLSIPKSVTDHVPAVDPNHRSDWPPFISLPSQKPPESDSNGTVRRLLPLDDASFCPSTPLAPELTPSAKNQLIQLGLDPDEPLFRVGRIYGSTHGLCSNCDKECTSEELVIRPLGMTLEQYQLLIDNGWYRRGGVKMFRLRHNHNMECCDWETRVEVSKFDHRTHKSYKKVLKRMPVDRLSVETVPASFNRDAFDLYNSYHIKKHDKPLKSEHSYCEHTVNTPTAHQTVNGVECGTFHQLYRLDGKLVAIGIIDIVPKGIVSIYMWYSLDKDVAKYSFGVYSALKEIELVQELSKKNPEMKYYYLQGWNGNNKKLNYKANYEPEEFYCPCIVSNWVSALSGVTEAKEKVVAENRRESGGGDTEKMVVDEPPVESTDGGGKSPGNEEKKECGNEEEADKKADKNEPSNGEASKTQPYIECKALPLDKCRYELQTGQSSVNISKVVICLNYSQYMYLEDMLRKYEVSVDQQEILESRFKELFLALSPELRSHLVIDMMALNSS
jgi:arginine-tRNA-protein transferase